MQNFGNNLFFQLDHAFHPAHLTIKLQFKFFFLLTSMSANIHLYSKPSRCQLLKHLQLSSVLLRLC